MSRFEKRRAGLLKRLAACKPFVAASLCAVNRTCGNPNCRCAREGPKHPAHLLTTKVNGKSQAIYVPVDMVEDVQQWCNQYRDLKADIKKVSDCCQQLIRLHTKEKRAQPIKPDKSKSK